MVRMADLKFIVGILWREAEAKSVRLSPQPGCGATRTPPLGKAAPDLFQDPPRYRIELGEKRRIALVLMGDDGGVEGIVDPR